MPTDVHPVFSIAILPPRRRAFGIDLVPLTLGHLLLLRELRNPILSSGKCSLGDFLQAAFVCAVPHSRARKNLTKQIRVRLFMFYWAWKCRKMNLVDESREIFAYLGDNFSCPQVDGRSTVSGEPTSPEEFRACAMLMSDFHMTFESALDIPIPVANSLWAANGERTGKVRFAPYGLSSGLERAWQHQHAIDLANQNAQN